MGFKILRQILRFVRDRPAVVCFKEHKKPMGTLTLCVIDPQLCVLRNAVTVRNVKGTIAIERGVTMMGQVYVGLR